MKEKTIAGLIAVLMIVSVAMLSGHVKGDIEQDLNSLNDTNGKIISSEKIDLDNIYQDTVECYRIKYLSDGLEVVGFILKPKQIDQKLPVIIYNRGGNREFGKIVVATLKYLSYLSSNNYVVLASQYRGNDGGQGKEEFGGRDINDVLNLVPMAESLPFIDSDRIVMLGYSRGGLMTYLAISKSSKIKAACVVGGVTDIIPLYNEREQAMKNVLIELIGGTPSEKEAEYKLRSACCWPEKINTPILILHGENDWRVNKSQAEKLANKLNELGKPHELVVYPNGSHGLFENREDRNRRIFEWFDKYTARFDTGTGTYPSIMGVHNGIITPSCDILVNKMYTYPCVGTSGHTTTIELYENDTLIANGTWIGYQNDWHNITIHNVSGASYVMLLKYHEYNYTIITGSYPQIHHTDRLEIDEGVITCTSFVDTNGTIYYDWIPAIRFDYGACKNSIR